jgi:uncharacterized protein (TIGR02145 family)
MQKINLLGKLFFFLLFTLSIKTVSAQTGLNFQGVARSSTNLVLASQDITIRLTILQGSASGNSEYSETRKVATNAQGLFTAVIGDMGALSTVGNFATINWKLTPKFLKIEMDPAAGTNFITMGTTQFQYVAYAQFAKSVDAENVVGILPVSSGGTGVNNISALKTALTIDKINNTTDADKPLSTATQTALGLKANTSDVTNSLANKVDKVSGKDLSTNDYTTIEKNKLSAITGTNTGDQDLSIYATSTSVALKVNTADLTASLANKVDKISGKGLTTNDYTTMEKTKLADIAGTNTGDQDLSLLATSTSVSLKENQSNKSTDALLGGINANDILFPTQKAVKDYVAANTAIGGIADFGITNIKLADLAVTDAKIADVAASKIIGTLGVAHGGTGGTTLTGMVKGNGTSALSAAIAGTDYLVPTGSAASLTNFPTFNQNTTGNATTATTAGTASTTTKLATSRNINGVAFDGSGDITLTADAGTLTGTTLKSTVTGSSLTSVGTITSGVWSGTTVAIEKGGTGLTAAGTAGQILTSTGSGTLTWTTTSTAVFLPTVVIGTQQWMRENLDVMTYRNGDVIPQVTDNTAWLGLTTGAWCWYSNSADNGDIYGKLYNWYAVNDPRGLAPQGWHIPTDAEWTTLSTLLGGDAAAGGKMKTTGISRWTTSNISANNESGFAGLPGGFRLSDGSFFYVREFGLWWSATGRYSANAWYRFLYHGNNALGNTDETKLCGFSVRCLRD